MGSMLRLDQVVLEESSRKVKIFDICFPFEVALDVLEIALQKKVQDWVSLG